MLAQKIANMKCPVRASALEQGKDRYFTWLACRNGHVVERNTNTGRCVECHRLYMIRYWQKYPDAVAKRNQYSKGYKFRNPENYEKQKEQNKQRWLSDEEYRSNALRRSSEYGKELYANPEYAEKRRLQGKEWFKNNAGVAKAKRARRRASERNATPDWLTAIHKAQIDQFYEVATALDMQTGIKHHVDHIVPLKAKIASGLHVPWNLQILTATENLRKHNSYGTH
jgi:hypothetical protein